MTYFSFLCEAPYFRADWKFGEYNGALCVLSVHAATGKTAPFSCRDCVFNIAQGDGGHPLARAPVFCSHGGRLSFEGRH